MPSAQIKRMLVHGKNREKRHHSFLEALPVRGWLRLAQANKAGQYLVAYRLFYMTRLSAVMFCRCLSTGSMLNTMPPPLVAHMPLVLDIYVHMFLCGAMPLQILCSLLISFCQKIHRVGICSQLSQQQERCEYSIWLMCTQSHCWG